MLALPVTAAAVATILMLLLVWIEVYLGSLSKSANYFHWHPFLMVSAFVGLIPFSVLIYRFSPAARDFKARKTTHLALNLTAWALSVAAVTIAFVYHSEKGYPHMYSVHSWMGITALTLLTIQVLFGVRVFVWPGASPESRAKLRPLHGFFGLATASLLALALVTGLFDMQRLLRVAPYNGAMVLPNVIALLIVFLFVFVGYHLSSAADSRYAGYEWVKTEDA